jgi:hypothetical protein
VAALVKPAPVVVMSVITAGSDSGSSRVSAFRMLEAVLAIPSGPIGAHRSQPRLQNRPVRSMRSPDRN